MEEENKMERQKQGLKPFISLVLSTNIPKVPLIIGLISSVITMIVGLSIPLLTRELVDGFSVEAISTALIVILVAVFVVQALADGIATYLLAAVGQKIVARMREMMWFKLIRLPISYFDKNKSGESVSRVVNDTGIVKDLISQHFPQFITGIITIVGALVILLIMDWKMTLLMLISLPVTMLVMIPL